MAIKVYHLAGMMPGGVPYEFIVIDPDREDRLPEYEPRGCTENMAQEIELEGDWPSMPSNTMFERKWE